MKSILFVKVESIHIQSYRQDDGISFQCARISKSEQRNLAWSERMRSYFLMGKCLAFQLNRIWWMSQLDQLSSSSSYTLCINQSQVMVVFALSICICCVEHVAMVMVKDTHFFSSHMTLELGRTDSAAFPLQCSLNIFASLIFMSVTFIRNL